MIEDTHSDLVTLATGLRDMQRALDEARADARVRDSERRRLAREVDLLSHLLCSRGLDVKQLSGSVSEQQSAAQ